MDASKIMQILKDTAYIRTGGSQEELRCAQYLMKCCSQLGLQAKLEPFAVQVSFLNQSYCKVHLLKIRLTDLYA